MRRTGACLTDENSPLRECALSERAASGVDADHCLTPQVERFAHQATTASNESLRPHDATQARTTPNSEH
jgi:hypothetical protein